MTNNDIPSVLVVDLDNETQITRPMNNDELVQLNIVLDELAQNEAEAKAKVEARESALAKLAALGLTQEEIEAL
jgi:hypothetical protein